MRCRKCNIDRKVVFESKRELIRGCHGWQNYSRRRGTCPECNSVRLTTWEAGYWEETIFTSGSQPEG